MRFIIRNQARIANKYLRFAKWKIRSLDRKFGQLIYTEIYINKISSSPDTYESTIKLGVPGPDIVVSAKSTNLNELWAILSSKMKRQLSKYANQNK